MNKTINNAIDKTVDGNENKEIIDVEEFSDKFSDTPFSNPLQQIISASIGDGEGEIDKIRKSLEKLFEKAYKDNKMVKEIIDAKAYGLWKLLTALIKKILYCQWETWKLKVSNFIWKTGCTYQKMSLCSYFCCSNTTILPSTATQGIKQYIEKYRLTTFGLRWSNTTSSTYPTTWRVGVQRPTRFKNKAFSTHCKDGLGKGIAQG